MQYILHQHYIILEQYKFKLYITLSGQFQEMSLDLSWYPVPENEEVNSLILFDR